MTACVDLPAGHSVLLFGGTAVRRDDAARARLLLVTLDRVGAAGALPTPAP